MRLFFLTSALFCAFAVSEDLPTPPDVSCVSSSPRWTSLKKFAWDVTRLNPSYLNTTVCSSVLAQFDDLLAYQADLAHPCPLGLLTGFTLRLLHAPPETAESIFSDFDKLFKFYILSNKMYSSVTNSPWPLVFASDWPLFELLGRLHRETRLSGPSRCGAESTEHRALWNHLNIAIHSALNQAVHPYGATTQATTKTTTQANTYGTREGTRERNDKETIRLSEKGREKWGSIYVGDFTVSARLADEAFSAFNNEWWRQECISGFMAIYLYRSVPFLVREKEGWGGRFFSGMNALMNEAGLLEVLQSEWPVFQILSLIKRLTRGDELGKFHPSIFRAEIDVSAVIGKFVASLQHAVDETSVFFASSRVTSLSELAPTQRLVYLADKYDANVKLIYIVPVYGAYSKYISLWQAQAASEIAFSLILTLDQDSTDSCASTDRFICLNLGSSLPPSVISKYIVAEQFIAAGFDVVLLDLDTWIFNDPTQRLLEVRNSADVILPSFYLTDNLNPFLVFYKASAASGRVLSQLKHWLFVNPFGEEHLAFDAVLGHRAWDVYIKNYQDASNLSWFFKKSPSTASPETTVKFHVLDSKEEFVSADGWLQADNQIKVFHFWGADESVEYLFNCLSSSSGSSGSSDSSSGISGSGSIGRSTGSISSGSSEGSSSYSSSGSSESSSSYSSSSGTTSSSNDSTSQYQCIEKYKKVPQYFRSELPVDFHLTSISYASGCCYEAQRLNEATALQHGANSTRKYSDADVDDDFKRAHKEIWMQKRGGGYWIWKPFLILKTLLSEEVQWGDVVVYLDAGNHYIDEMRTKVRELLKDTDVSGGYLKCCIESDWTKRDALILLNGDKSSILDRPQMAAYFLLFRKSPVSIKFVNDWLKACTDPRIVTDLGNTLGFPNHPTFTNHIHDQAAFSILFKANGFKGFDLDRAHEIMKLARWRE